MTLGLACGNSTACLRHFRSHDRQPIDAALAVDAIAQTFEVTMPMRQAVAKAPPGPGERFVFRRTDGPQAWTVRFDGAPVLLLVVRGHLGGAPQLSRC